VSHADLQQWKYSLLLAPVDKRLCAHAARMLGLSPRSDADTVLAEIERRLHAARTEG
jgi:hypothetical protein